MAAVTATLRNFLVVRAATGPAKRTAAWRASSHQQPVSPGVMDAAPQTKSYEELHRFSIEHPDLFWGDQARLSLTWSRDFTTAMDCDMKAGQFKWFEDGRLNASVNCVDRHAATNPDKVAIIWEKDEPGQHVKVSFNAHLPRSLIRLLTPFISCFQVTYGELLDMVCRIANVFKSKGIGKGDVVAVYMPISPLAVATMLACTRIGAIHSVIFAGFSAGAIASRY